MAARSHIWTCFTFVVLFGVLHMIANFQYIVAPSNEHYRITHQHLSAAAEHEQHDPHVLTREKHETRGNVEPRRKVQGRETGEELEPGPRKQVHEQLEFKGKAEADETVENLQPRGKLVRETVRKKLARRIEVRANAEHLEESRGKEGGEVVNNFQEDKPIQHKLNATTTRPTTKKPTGLVRKVKTNIENVPHVKTEQSQILKHREETYVQTKGEEEQQKLPLCPKIPPSLEGQIQVTFEAPSWSEMDGRNPELLPGGRWRPKYCRARHRVAIVIPYRAREEQLRMFLNHMHPFLSKQQLEYGIYVVEMAKPTTFNRAMLMNIGFVEANKAHHYDCVIFHDVDILPEDDRNMYSCPEQPRHMSAALDKHKYKLRYRNIFGGIVAFKNSHFREVNGFSNLYFGWGGEDDDLRRRVSYRKLIVTRYPLEIARYKALIHRTETANKDTGIKCELLRHWKERVNTDGLNSLKYKRLDFEEKHLFTWIYVEVEGPKGDFSGSINPKKKNHSCGRPINPHDKEGPPLPAN